MASTPSKPIRVAIPAPIVSPLEDLLPLVPAALINAAPERRDALIAELQGSVEFEIVAERRFIAHYHPGNRRITISFRVVELLWCVAYAYVVLFEDVYATRSAADATPVDLTADPIVRGAMELLRWALQDWVDRAASPIPALPVRLPRKLGSHTSVADELCLIAVASILHHELGHHRLKHEGIPRDTKDERLLALSVEQEKQADGEAADWLLSMIEPNGLFFTKRAAGLIVALMAIAAYGIHTEQHDGRHHPRRFERLFNSLDRYVRDPNHAAWVFATVALKLHLDHSGYKVPVKEYETFRDCISAYLDVIADAEAAKIGS
jgi:Peptidase U49